MVYLDYNSTAAPFPEVIEAMMACLQGPPGNPASQHQPGQTARRELESARSQILTAFGGVDGKDQLILTSGATEANNLALRGIANGPGGVAISAIEHPSVTGPADWLASQNHRVHHIRVDSDGQLDLAHLDELLQQDLRLVSLMLANHETGVIQPVQLVTQKCREHGVAVHTDATQAAGKMDIDIEELGVDALTFSAHKFQGPVGVGGCILRATIADHCHPLLYGGFQQSALRPGTESTPLAVGAAAALAVWQDRGESLRVRITAHRDAFERLLLRQLQGIVIHGQRSPRNPQTSNVGFCGLDRQALWLALDQAGVACSTGSACASGSSQVSAVLSAMKLPSEQIEGALRFSFGSLTTAAEVELAVEHISRIYNHLRSSRYARKRPEPSREEAKKTL